MSAVGVRVGEGVDDWKYVGTLTKLEQSSNSLTIVNDAIP